MWEWRARKIYTLLDRDRYLDDRARDHSWCRSRAQIRRLALYSDCSRRNGDLTGRVIGVISTYLIARSISHGRRSLREQLVLGNGRAGGRRSRGRASHRLGLPKSLVEALRRAGPRRHNFRLRWEKHTSRIFYLNVKFNFESRDFYLDILVGGSNSLLEGAEAVGVAHLAQFHGNPATEATQNARCLLSRGLEDRFCLLESNTTKTKTNIGQIDEARSSFSVNYSWRKQRS